MKPIHKKILIGLAILAFIGLTYYISYIIFKGKKDYYDIPQKSQITGYWKLVEWNAEMKKQNKVDPWPFKYQWFGIYEDGHLYSYMANQTTSQLGAKQLESLFKAAPANVTYTYDKGIMKVTYTNIPNMVEVWAVTVVTKKEVKNGVEFLPGDLLMSLVNEKGESVYYRHLRKVT